MNFTKRSSCLALLTAVLLAGIPVIRGEMRKSWQAKSVDVHAQLLKAARLEEPPSAKPPEAIGEGAVERTEQSAVPAAEEATPKSPPGAVRSAQFSSRVRSQYGAVKPGSVSVKPIEASERTEPLQLESIPDDIQVDDATVQDDDDDDEEEEDDEDDLVGWGEQVAKHGKEFDLIGNILDEVKQQSEEKTKEETPASDTRTKEVDESKQAEERLKEYTFPPVLNMTIDEPNSIVRVKLNQDVLRDMLSTGRQGGGGIGGKKMLRYILPLFILPFLIQSAVIPFMLTAVKLFLMKSLMAGKVAIFLLLLGAFKNFTKKESRDVYVKDVPDRRYEPSSEGFAYLAEGRPSNWVN